MTNPETDQYGNKFWYNEKREYHREGGPAIEWFDGEEWWLNGKKHREDGPANEWLGDHKSWYYNGERIHCSTQEEFEKIIKLRMFW
jgi:hypothetical protein